MIRIHYLIFIVVSIGFCTAEAQDYKTTEDINSNCALVGLVDNSDAVQAVDDILAAVGLFKNFVVQECPNVNLVAAKNILKADGTTKRYLIYQGGFFSNLNQGATRDWKTTGILAHQVAHLLKEHDLNASEGVQEREMEAAELAGFVLAKLGASQEEAKAMIDASYFSKTPMAKISKESHVQAVEAGWKRGEGNIVSNTTITEEEKKDIVVIENRKDPELPTPSNEVVDENKAFAQKVLAKNVEAVGGVSKINRIRSMTQKSTTSMRMNINGNITETETKMTIDRIAPNKILNTVDMPSLNTTTYSLVLDGSSYTKTGANEPWTFVRYDDNPYYKSASFIYEYSLLVKNEDIAYLGEETKNGIRCYVIQMPENRMTIDDELFTVTTNTEMEHYYSVESGLLLFGEFTVHTITDYKQNNEYLKDTNTTTSMSFVYGEYKEVEGILFPFKVEMDMDSDTFESTIETVYTDILINPNLDPSDFEVKE